MIQQRFWSKVKTVESGCMEFSGNNLPKGYGRIWFNGGKVYAHRLALRLSGVYFDESMHVLHKCDNPRCVNPLHLYPGDPKQNAKDMMDRNRGDGQFKKGTHCKNGHEFVDGSFFVPADGHRRCRICQNETQRKLYWKNRDEDFLAKKRAWMKAWGEKNKEKLLARKREAYAAKKKQEIARV